MDTTETIILTSVVNIIITGLVGGLIIYRIHKKIDNSYAKQLKEFEAELQYSNFEQQTKFAAIHAKRVEALEGLYQNYVSFIEAVDKVIVGMKAAQDKKLTIGTLEWNRHKEHLTGKLGDFRNYFQTNCFFLPAGINDQIWDIYHKSELVQFTVGLQSHSFEQVVHIPNFWLLPLLELLDLKSVDKNINQPIVFLDTMSTLIHGQARRIEKLYNSVADTTDHTSMRATT